MGRLTSRLLLVPVTATSLSAGHWLAYRLAVPDGHERELALADGGHAYLEYAPLVLALCFSLGLIALARRTLAGFRGLREPPSLARSVALVPPLAFLLQEQLERLAHGADPALTLPIGVGVLIQIPFALVAVLVARALETLAEGLGAALSVVRPRRARVSLVLSRPALDLAPRRLAGLALGYAERGPPPSDEL